MFIFVRTEECRETVQRSVPIGDIESYSARDGIEGIVKLKLKSGDWIMVQEDPAAFDKRLRDIQLDFARATGAIDRDVGVALEPAFRPSEMSPA